jgi:hypothetical protein
MIDPAAHSFTLGRASLLNGPSCVPFPAQFSEQQDGRIRMSGIYHPEAVANDSPVLRDGRRLAFQQQWIGLNDEPDAVPLVSTRQPQLTGMYQVLSATVDWVASLTINGGTVSYSAELRRLKPASAAAIHEIQYQTAKRSTDEHAVTSAGAVWLPGTRTHTDFAPAVALTRNTIDESGVIGGLVPGGGTAGTVGTLSFSIAATDFYQAACTVEIRYNGSDSPWVPVQGTQIPNVPFYDLRVTNGVNRFTWTNTTGTVHTAGKQIVLEHVIVTGGVYTWAVYATTEIFGAVNSSAGFTEPIATPTILRNTPESVVVRYPVTAGADAFGYFTVTINRGDSFATLATDPQILFVWMNKTSNDNTALVGGRRSDATSNGYGWTLLTTDPVTLSTSDSMQIAETSATVQVLAVGPYSSSVTTDADYDDLAAQWWLAAGYTQRAVAA